jgi:hypothetical protein
MTEWEKQKENAARAWSAMSTDQHDLIHVTDMDIIIGIIGMIIIVVFFGV